MSHRPYESAMKSIVALSLLTLLTVRPAAGQGRVSECIALGAQLAISSCLSDAYNAADADLNAAYRAVRERLAPPAASRLREAQRAWIEFRDIDCEASVVRRPNQAWVVGAIRSACGAEHAWDRVRTLRGTGDPSLRSRLCPDSSSREAATCVARRHEAADAALNRTYRDLISGMGERSAASLREAQRAWIQFRDADCQSVGGETGATACRTIHTLDRVRTLRAHHIPDARWESCDLMGCGGR